MPRAQFASLAARSAILLLCCVMLAGCQSFSSPSSSARIRIIDVSPDAPALDVYQGNNAIAYNINFGAVTSYVPVQPGNAKFSVSPAGSRQALSSIEGVFSANTSYTVLVNSSIADLQQVILTDRSQPSAIKGPLTPSIRFIHQASRMGPVDVYLVPSGQRITSVSPIATNLLPGANTGYITVPACTCAAVMLPAGTVPSMRIASHIEKQTIYENGSARTLILLDPSPTSSPGLQVITTIDADTVS